MKTQIWEWLFLAAIMLAVGLVVLRHQWENIDIRGWLASWWPFVSRRRYNQAMQHLATTTRTNIEALRTIELMRKQIETIQHIQQREDVKNVINITDAAPRPH